MHISTQHMGALESDTGGLLAQLAHICLLGGWVGWLPTQACLLLLHSYPAQLTKCRQKLFALLLYRLLCDNFYSDQHGGGIKFPSATFEIFQMDPGNSICAHLRADHNKNLRLQMMINGSQGGGAPLWHAYCTATLISSLLNFSLHFSDGHINSLLMLTIHPLYIGSEVNDYCNF